MADTDALSQRELNSNLLHFKVKQALMSTPSTSGLQFIHNTAKGDTPTNLYPRTQRATLRFVTVCVHAELPIILQLHQIIHSKIKQPSSQTEYTASPSLA